MSFSRSPGPSEPPTRILKMRHYYLLPRAVVGIHSVRFVDCREPQGGCGLHVDEGGVTVMPLKTLSFWAGPVERMQALPKTLN